MKLVFLGTYGFNPTNEGHTVCCMLPEVGIVLDAGSGAFRVPHYQQTDDLFIYLTHAHLDHTIGLTYLMGGYLKRVVDEAKQTGEASDFRSVIERADTFSNNITICTPEAVWVDVKRQFGGWDLKTHFVDTADNRLPKDGILTYFPLKHSVECYGYRFQWKDKSLAYVVDTFADPDAEYVQHIAQVDVLIHDCYLPDSWAEFARMTDHSHTSAVAQVAAQAQVGQLILTHHNSVGLDIELATARAIFPETIMAVDGMEISF